MKIIKVVEDEKFRRKSDYISVRARGYPQAPNDRRFSGSPDEQIRAAHEWQVRTWGWLGGYATRMEIEE